MPTCATCETPLVPDRPFCGGCGNPAVAAAPAAPAAPACSGCGAPLGDGAFCGECGTPREQPAPAPAPVPSAPAWSPAPAFTRPRRRTRVWPGVAAGVAVLLAFAGFMFRLLGLMEAGMLLLLVLLAIGLAAGLTRDTSPDPGPAPLLTDPTVASRELVYSRFGVEHGPVSAQELARVAAAERLPATTQVRDTAGGAWFPLGELVRTTSEKSYGVAVALTFFLGALGAHWFYLRRPGLGLLRLVAWAGTMAVAVAAVVEAGNDTGYYDAYSGLYVTGGSDAGGLLVALVVASGVLTLWSLLDLVLVATRSVRDGDGRPLP